MCSFTFFSLPPYASILKHTTIIKYLIQDPKHKKALIVWSVFFFFSHFIQKAENRLLSEKPYMKTFDFTIFTVERSQKMTIIYYLIIDRMTITDMRLTFSPNSILKHSKPRRKLHSSSILWRYLAQF